METFKTDKAKKLLRRLKIIVIILRNNPHLRLHGEVDQYTYIQRIEEMNIILDQFDDLREKFKRLSEILDDRYQMSYCQWRRDVMQLRRMLALDQQTRKTVL